MGSPDGFGMTAVLLRRLGDAKKLQTPAHTPPITFMVDTSLFARKQL
jgi:hypothetical protein